MNNFIKVLIVDDSAYVRKIIKKILSRSPFIEVVGAANNGLDALDKVTEFNPDVITLDLNMPEMDGIAFLKEQMKRRPLPVVIVSIADRQSEKVLEAMDSGAIDFVQKPTALATEKILDLSDELIEKVKTAANVSLSHLTWLQKTEEQFFSTPIIKPQGHIEIVLIGISTGGPQSLTYLIPQFPADFPVPVAIVLHMPVGYTEMYASRLNQMSQLHVVEAQDGQTVCPGAVFIAPAGKHLTFKRDNNDTVITQLKNRPFDTLHRPSVDVMLQSAAEIYGDRTLAVIMTGMGSDGKEGAAWIKNQGGVVITEAESSCIVYGMPRSVVEAGLSDRSVTLENMAQEIINLL